MANISSVSSRKESEQTKPSQELNAVASLVYIHVTQLAIFFSFFLSLPLVILKKGDSHFFSKRTPDNAQHPGAY